MDPKEKLRLEAIRTRLKLVKWSKIYDTYNMSPDDKTTDWLNELRKQRPAEYEQKWSDWEKYFSDFDNLFRSVDF